MQNIRGSDLPEVLVLVWGFFGGWLGAKQWFSNFLLLSTSKVRYLMAIKWLRCMHVHGALGGYSIVQIDW
jgi:hypothetical protein